MQIAIKDKIWQTKSMKLTFLTVFTLWKLNSIWSCCQNRKISNFWYGIGKAQFWFITGSQRMTVQITKAWRKAKLLTNPIKIQCTCIQLQQIIAPQSTNKQVLRYYSRRCNTNSINFTHLLTYLLQNHWDLSVQNIFLKFSSVVRK